MWTARQRTALIGLLAIMLAILAAGWWRNPTTIPADFEGDGALVTDSAGRIDPNVASASELAALPTIGPGRAAAIIEYRRAWRASRGDSPAFSSADDLANVKGIGPATVEQLRPWLVFDEP